MGEGEPNTTTKDRLSEGKDHKARVFLRYMESKQCACFRTRKHPAVRHMDEAAALLTVPSVFGWFD